jgi:DNA-binding GntR family transcriptional regulator
MAELREVITARGVIEPWAASTLAGRADRSGTVAALRKLISKIHEIETSGDDRAFQEADREFHQCLLTEAGNGLLSGFYSSLRDRQLRGGSLALQNHPGRETEIMAQHVMIVDAIERGDAEAASAAIAAHVDTTALELGLAPLG